MDKPVHHIDNYPAFNDIMQKCLKYNAKCKIVVKNEFDEKIFKLSAFFEYKYDSQERWEIIGCGFDDVKLTNYDTSNTTNICYDWPDRQNIYDDKTKIVNMCIYDSDNHSTSIDFTEFLDAMHNELYTFKDKTVIPQIAFEKIWDTFYQKIKKHGPRPSQKKVMGMLHDAIKDNTPYEHIGYHMEDSHSDFSDSYSYSDSD